jgi:hypothetical protein
MQEIISLVGPEYDAVKRRYATRDEFALPEGQWLYFKKLDDGAPLFQLSFTAFVKSAEFKSDYANIQWDEKGEPQFKGFTNNTTTNNPYDTNPQTSYITDSVYQSMIRPSGSDPMGRCISKMVTWI